MLKWTAVNTYIWPPSSQSLDILSSISTLFLTQALRKTVLWLLWYSLDRCAIKSPWYPLHVEQQKSIYRLHAGIGGGGGGGLFFDASKQYTCLQCPWSPFAEYISHIPMAPFNTEKCKERLALPFLPTARREIHNDPLRTTWDLVVVVVGGGTMPVLSNFYR